MRTQARSQEFAMGGGGGLAAETPALKNFAFFCKNNFILELFDSKIMLSKRGIKIGSANMIKLVA